MGKPKRMASIVKVYGPVRAASFMRMAAAGGDIVTVPLPSTGEVHLRRVSSDMSVFAQIFLDGEYELTLSRDPAWILDLGSHIGLSVRWFAARYPGVPIVAVEPDADNHALLVRNTQGLPEVRVVNAAVGGRSGSARLMNGEDDTWAYRFEEASDGIPVLTVEELLKDLVGRGPGLVKMDVEGSEVEIFAADCTWLDSVSDLLIETHERFRPGSEASIDVGLGGRPHRRGRSGENVHIMVEQQVG
jgi:FkbM family methyltransferase